MTFEYKREPLEEYEIEQMRRHCKSFEEELIVNVLLETGLRVSEFTHLREDNISWQRSCITLIGKGNKRRVIPMSDTARFYLSNIFKSTPKIPMAMRTVQKYIKIVAERARITKIVSPHVLRHTFAVCYLHKGGNLRALQSILGHSSITTTDVYLNYSGQRVIEDFQKVWNKKETIQTINTQNNETKTEQKTEITQEKIESTPEIKSVKLERSLLEFI